MPRPLLLVACVALGLAIGWAGHALTGSQWWFLAIPGAMAIAWLFVANPEKCLPGQDSSNDSRPVKK